MQNNDTFMPLSALQNHIDSAKLALLNSISDIAKKANLKAKHLYKDFSGLYVAGNLALLQKPLIAIIGTREPNQYTRHYTAMLSRELSRSFAIISGGAIGVDSIAHANSGKNIVMVLPCGINLNYPIQNSRLINFARESGLVVSEYERDFMPHKYSFLERNRIIIALSDAVIIPQADLKSGSMSSALLTYALKKPLFVLPHRINESLGTHSLLAQDKARCIYDIRAFVESLRTQYGMQCESEEGDEILEFARSNGLFSEAMKRFGDKVLEYELEGKIMRNGIYIGIGE